MTQRTPAELAAEIEALDKAATPAPWKWALNRKGRQCNLESDGQPAHLRETVMDFVRWGMSGAQPRFNVDGIMHLAESRGADVPGREHHASWHQSVDHPDAQFIARARTLLPEAARAIRELLAERDSYAKRYAEWTDVAFDLKAENATLRALLAECLAFNPTTCGSYDQVLKWSDVVRRMRAAAQGGGSTAER